jgi:hypothetical protein
MITQAVLILCALAVSGASSSAALETPSTMGDQAEPNRFFMEGSRLAKHVKVGMAESEVRAIFGKNHEPEKYSLGFGLVPTLLVYREYGVTISTLCGSVTSVDAKWESDRQPLPPPPVGIGFAKRR